MSIVERANAKINLYLHILDKRADGYHELESLAVFARHGDAASDVITLTPGGPYALTIDGPYAGSLNESDANNNLISKALNALAAKTGKALDFKIKLTKNLPIASGIGGGSSDAGAALRAAATFFGLAADDAALLDAARVIGADGLVCYRNQNAFMRGIGDIIEPVFPLPRTAMLLINPNIPLPTAAVYKQLDRRFSPALPFKREPKNVKQLGAMLGLRGNDLQKPALELCEAIQDVLDVIAAADGCLLARLSGSGATCFGLFESQEAAEAAATHIRSQIKEWWVATTGFGEI